MVLCAECKRKNVYIEQSGQPAEFCSNQCRKAAVENGHVQGCVVCSIYPQVRLPSGIRSPYCGRQCQSRAGTLNPPPAIPIGTTGMRPPAPPPTLTTNCAQPVRVNGGTWVPVPVPICRYCQVKPCWRDPLTQKYLIFCGRTCKDAFEGMSPSTIVPTSPTHTKSVLPILQNHKTSQVTIPNQYTPADVQLRPYQSTNPSINDQPTNGLNQPTNQQEKQIIYQQTDGQLTNGQHQQITNGQHQQIANGQHQQITNGQHQQLTNEQHQQLTNVQQPTNLQQPTNGQHSYPINIDTSLQEYEDSRPPPPPPNKPPPPSILSPISPNSGNASRPVDGDIDNALVNSLNVPPPPYEPNDRYPPNTSDRKITRDDNFDDNNPYGFRDYLNSNGAGTSKKF